MDPQSLSSAYRSVVPPWPLSLLMLTPLASVYLYDPESLRLMLGAVAGAGLFGSAAWAIARRPMAKPPGLLALFAMLFAIVLVTQAARSTNLLSAGSMLIIHLTGLGATLALAASSDLRARFMRLMPVVVPLVAIVAGAVGIAGLFGLQDSKLVGQTSELPASLFVNSNYGGTFAALFLPLTIAAFLAADRRWLSTVQGLAVTILAAYLVISGSRIGLLSVVIAGGILAILWAVRRRTGFVKGKALGIALLLVLIGCALAFVLMRTDQRSHWKGRFENPANVSMRLRIWKASWTLFGTNPVVGIGLGNYPTQIHSAWIAEDFRDLERPWEKIPMILPDPHNTYLGWLVELGPGGLTLYLCIVVVCVLSFIRQWRSPESGTGEVWTWAWAGTLVASLLCGVTNTLSIFFFHSIAAYLALGMMAGCFRPDRPVEDRFPRLVVALAPGLLTALLITGALLQATHFPARYVRLRYWSNGARNGEDLDLAFRLHPWKAHDHAETGKALIKNNLPAVAAVEFRRALLRDPLNPNAWTLLAESCLLYGKSQEAESSFRRASELAPSWPYPKVREGQLLQALTRFQESRELFKDICRRWPTYPDSHFHLGASLASLGHFEQALTELREAKRLGCDVGRRLKDDPAFWTLRAEFKEFTR